MNPEELFCLNPECPAKGQVGKGNISIHSKEEGRCRCHVCNATFSCRRGTIFYRVRTKPEIVILVLTLLAYGCPTQAIVKAFGFDERTVKKWWERAGRHCDSFHQYTVGQSQLDLQHVQADEIKAKAQGGSFWMAMSMMVPTRLWLGGVISPRRDKALIQQLGEQIRAIALCRPLLLAVDGLASYVSVFQNVFRSPVPRFGLPGRPQMVAWENIAIVQVVKNRAKSDFRVDRRIIQGCATMIQRLIDLTQGATGCINTAYIERLNATFRQRLHWLSRRSRSLAQQAETLNAGMFIVGVLYNFCDNHHSLRFKLWITERHHRWVQRTPAMAALLTDHQWTVHEVFWFRIPPPRWVPPPRRGRPSKEMTALLEQWA